MRRCAILFAGLIVFCHAAFAESADERAIAQADSDFYKASSERGAAAWGEFAADDAKLPYGSGKAEIAAAMAKSYAKPGFRLTWHPAFAKAFGDVGVTSGPYELHQADQKETGTYVTVWRRQKDGSWRFVWDGGTEDGPKTNP